MSPEEKEAAERAEALKHQILCCAWCGFEIEDDHYRFRDGEYLYRLHNGCYNFLVARPFEFDLMTK